LTVLLLSIGGLNLAISQTEAPTIIQMATDSSGKRVAVYKSDNSLSLYDITTGKLIRKIGDKKIFLQQLALANDGHTIAAADFLGGVELWDMDQGAKTEEVPANAGLATSIIFSGNGQILAIGNADGRVTLVDVSAGKVIRQWPAHQQSIPALAFSSNDEYLAAGSWDKTISVWEVKTGTRIALLSGHTNWVTAVAFDRQSGHLVSGGSDGLVNTWDVPTGKCISSAAATFSVDIPIPTPVHSVAFSNDGNSIYAVSIGFAGMWNASTGARIHTFDHLSAQSLLIAKSSVGNNISIIGTDGSVALLDTSGPAPAQNIILR
jgi:WD40 repeat protein